MKEKVVNACNVDILSLNEVRLMETQTIRLYQEPLFMTKKVTDMI